MSNQSVPFRERANLSIPEAMEYTKLGRKAVDERLELGRWKWFWEGSRKRIITSSIHEDQNAQSEGLRAA